jgi:Holliday junction resolvasome RuvABC endonuclease subunit
MILALDLSLRQTGYAIIDNNKIIKSSIIKSPVNLRGVQRLDFLLVKVTELLENIEFVVIEDYAYSAYGSMTNLAELCGIVKYFLYKTKIPFLLLSTTALKKFVIGKGNAPKAMMMPAIFKKYKIETKSTDEADAIGLAKLAYAVSLMKKGELSADKYLQYENDVLSNIYDSENRESTYKLR